MFKKCFLSPVASAVPYRIARFDLSNNSRYAFYSTSNSSVILTEKVLKQKLEKTLNPSFIKVVDVSGGCGTMFTIDLVSDAFKQKSLIQQHRLVNEILKEEIKLMHGLQLNTSTE